MRLIVLMLALSLATFGCASVSRFEKGEVVAFGQRLDDASAPLYYLIRIDARNTAPQRVPQFLVELGPDAPPLAAAALTPEAVAALLPRFTPPPQWPDSLRRRALEDDAYEGHGFYIAFTDGRMSYLSVCSHCAGERRSPVVGTADGSAFFALPLTEQQMSAVFGRPDRVRKVREVTY